MIHLSTWRIWHLPIICLLGLVLTMYPMSINAQEENVASPQDSVPSIVELPLNKVQPIDLKRNVRDVIVANPEVADVIIKTQTKAYIIGRTTGDTDILFVDEAGNVINHIIARVDLDVAAATAAIRAVVPLSLIHI